MRAAAGATLLAIPKPAPTLNQVDELGCGGPAPDVGRPTSSLPPLSSRATATVAVASSVLA